MLNVLPVEVSGTTGPVTVLGPEEVSVTVGVVVITGVVTGVVITGEV